MEVSERRRWISGVRSTGLAPPGLLAAAKLFLLSLYPLPASHEGTHIHLILSLGV